MTKRAGIRQKAGRVTKTAKANPVIGRSLKTILATWKIPLPPAFDETTRLYLSYAIGMKNRDEVLPKPVVHALLEWLQVASLEEIRELWPEMEHSDQAISQT